MPRKISPQLRQKTLDILRERFKPAEIDIVSAKFLSEPERRNVLMRIKLTSNSAQVPESVILKQVLPQKGDADDKQADARFARDWSGLEFASRVQQYELTQNTPVFYGSDAEDRFILIEDLGKKHVSLVDSLLVANRDKAVSALERYMKALGSFHAKTFGRSDEYAVILKRINEDATTPEDDLVSITEYLVPKLESSAQKLELEATDSVLDEAAQVLDAMYKPGPFTVLAHGDIAPDNVFDLPAPKGLQLIDFEWCAPRNALLDGTYLRMSIPTGWCAKTIPDEVLTPLEQIYRAELEKAVPAASDDLAYSTAYTHACAFHVLHQIANLEGILDKDSLWGGALPQYPLWDAKTNSSRSRFLSRLQAFLDVADAHDKTHPNQPPILPNLRSLAANMLIKAKERWPEDTKPLDSYPAFKQAAPQLVQTVPARIRHPKPRYMEPTESFLDKAREKYKHSSDVSKAVTAQFKEQMHDVRVVAKPRYMEATVSSANKEREVFNPFEITARPAWRP